MRAAAAGRGRRAGRSSSKTVSTLSTAAVSDTRQTTPEGGETSLREAREELATFLQAPSAAAVAAACAAWRAKIADGRLSSRHLATALGDAAMGCHASSSTQRESAAVPVAVPVGEWAGLVDAWWSADSADRVVSPAGDGRMPWLVTLCLAADDAVGEASPAEPSVCEILVDRLAASTAAACAGANPWGEWSAGPADRAEPSDRWVPSVGHVSDDQAARRRSTAAAAAFAAAVCRWCCRPGADADAVRALVLDSLVLGLPRPIDRDHVDASTLVSERAAPAVAVVAAVADTWPAALGIVSGIGEESDKLDPLTVALRRVVRALAAVPEGRGVGEGVSGGDGESGNGVKAWMALRRAVIGGVSTAELDESSAQNDAGDGSGSNVVEVFDAAVRAAGDDVVAAAVSTRHTAEGDDEDGGVELVESTAPPNSTRQAVELAAAYLGWPWVVTVVLSGPLSTLLLGAEELLSGGSPAGGRLTVEAARVASAVRLVGPLYRGAAAHVGVGGGAATHGPAAVSSRLARVLRAATVAAGVTPGDTPAMHATTIALAAAAALREVRDASRRGGLAGGGGDEVDAALAEWTSRLGTLVGWTAKEAEAVAPVKRGRRGGGGKTEGADVGVARRTNAWDGSELPEGVVVEEM